MRRGKRKYKRGSFGFLEKLGAAAFAVVVIGAVALTNRGFPKPLPVASRPFWSAISQQGPAPASEPPALKALLGKEIDLAGFVIPDDASSVEEMTEFLLTPVAAGCIHVPPPPPNLVIRVSMRAGQRTKTQTGAVSVHGQLELARNSGGSSGYYVEMTADRVEAL